MVLNRPAYDCKGHVIDKLQEQMWVQFAANQRIDFIRSECEQSKNLIKYHAGLSFDLHESAVADCFHSENTVPLFPSLFEQNFATPSSLSEKADKDVFRNDVGCRVRGQATSFQGAGGVCSQHVHYVTYCIMCLSHIMSASRTPGSLENSRLALPPLTKYVPFKWDLPPSATIPRCFD